MYKIGSFQCRGWGNFGIYDDRFIEKMDKNIPVVSQKGFILGSEDGWDNTGIDYDKEWLETAVKLMNERDFDGKES